MTIHDWKLLCPNYLLLTGGSPCERCRGGKYYQCTLHNCIGHSLPKSVLGTIEAYIHHAKKYYEDFIDCLIAPSDFVKQEFIKFGWPEKKIVVLPHFLPGSILRATEPPSLPEKNRYVYFGRLSQEKGIERLVNYWLDKNISYPLDVFGDGPLYEKLKKITLDSKRIVLHGQTPREKLYLNLEKITAVISPSLCFETFGLAALESFAKGLPVVATKLGGLEELGRKSGAAVFFDWSDGSLEKALEASSSTELRQNAISFMRNNFTSQEYYQKMMSIFSRNISA